MQHADPDELADDIDHGRLARVIGQYSVRLAVLFGSHVRGTETQWSDVDIAVEFEESVPDDERVRERARLAADLMKELGTEKVDVADLDTIRPNVGKSALENGVVLIGTEDRANRLHGQFEQRAATTTREERMNRFDDLIARMNDLV